MRKQIINKTESFSCILTVRSFNLNIIVTLILIITLIASCNDNSTQTVTDTSEAVTQIADKLGVLIVYMDPGIDHDRAKEVFESAKKSGAKWVRIGFIWALANPIRDKYDFKEFDWIINTAKSYNLNVLPIVTWTPGWVSLQPPGADMFFYPPTDEVIGDYDAGLGTIGTGYDYLHKFGKELSSHYKDRITYFEFWNEPDMKGYLRDINNNNSTADEYAKMLAYFYKGVKSGNPNAKVLLGGLAQGPVEYGCEQEYLGKILNNSEYPGDQNFDILNFHTNFKSMDEIKNQIDTNKQILAGKNISKSFWITETSYTSDIHYQTVEGYQSGTESLAKYIKDSIIVQLDTGAEVVFWAALLDYKPTDPGPYQYSGLYTYDLTEKDAVHSLRLIAETK